MANTTTTVPLFSPKQSLSAEEKESQKDWDANILDFGLVMMACPLNGAKTLAFGPVVNGESLNHKLVDKATPSIALTATMGNGSATVISCPVSSDLWMESTRTLFLRALEHQIVSCGVATTRDRPENATGQVAWTMRVSSMHALIYMSTVMEKTATPPAH